MRDLRRVINMLIALNEKGEVKLAEKNLLKKENYYCPSCKSKVYLRRGQIMRPHFAHYKRENCQVFSEGETAEHLKGKLALANYLRSIGKRIQLEAYLPELKQRPDILIRDMNKKIALEFQCSSIAIEKIHERTRGYLTANYDVIWILGKVLSQKKPLTALQKSCLYFSSFNKMFLLLHYDVDQEDLEITYNHQLNNNAQMIYKRKVIHLNQENQINLKNGQWVGPKKKEIKTLREKQKELMKRIRSPNESLLNFLSLIYRNRENPITIPMELHQTFPSEWFIETYSMTWKYLFVLWLESHRINDMITQKSLSNWLEKKIDQKEIIIYFVQNINKNIRLKPFVEFLDYLSIRGIVKKRRNQKWTYQKPLKRFKSIQEKIES